jgi:hypothetical protein
MPRRYIAASWQYLSCLRIDRIPEVQKVAVREIMEKRIVIMALGEGKTLSTSSRRSRADRAPQKGAAIDECLECVHVFS